MHQYTLYFERGGFYDWKVLLRCNLKYPVLLRLLSKEFETPKKNQKTITPMVHKSSVDIELGDKQLQYFECSKNIPLQVKTTGPKTLRIISRLKFSEKMGGQEFYRIHVKSGQKVVGTYFFNTERSGSSKVRSKPDIVPGKWRSCELIVPKGENSYSIEVFDEGKAILTRFMLY